MKNDFLTTSLFPYPAIPAITVLGILSGSPIILGIAIFGFCLNKTYSKLTSFYIRTKADLQDSLMGNEFNE